MTTRYPVTGIKAGTGPGNVVPVRQEFNSWISNPDNAEQISLFMYALSYFQGLSPKEMLSYFQIAGIHGQPYQPWNEDTKPQAKWEGYCTHNSLLFPTWHRPYVILIEQLIHEIMIGEIIPRYPADQQPHLTDVANAWRLPYWDWAAPPREVPNGMLYPTTMVIPPGGGLGYIPNPLYNFIMPNGEVMGSYGVLSPFNVCKATSRCPAGPQVDPNGFINGTENNDIVDKNLQGIVSPSDKNLTDIVYRLFTYPVDYETFATTALHPSPDPRDFLNAEAIHNNVHGMVGGGWGQMGRVPVAAFDPIFWFHHCNVDRQVAIWQTLNPDQWFDNPKVPIKDGGTWDIPTGTLDTPTVGLGPFYKNLQGPYLNSNDVRNWFGFGYTYPELQPFLPKYNQGGVFNQQLYIDDLKQDINNLYGHQRNIFLGRPLNGPGIPHHVDVAPALLQVVLRAAAQKAAAPVARKATALKHNDYVINFQYDRYALRGRPYRINIYIGPTEPTNPEAGYIGFIYNFSSPLPEGHDEVGCEHCKVQRRQGILSQAQLPITTTLMQHAEDRNVSLPSLDNDAVEEYLAKHLRWKIYLNTGEEVPISSIPPLRISVSAGTAVHYEDNKTLSKYTDYRILHRCTEGKEGGLQPGEGYE